MLKSESVTAVNYFSIIKTIADGNHKLGKIAGILGQETSSLTPYLSTLLDLGFIEKRTPITEKNPEKSRKGLYFIADNFIRFWFRYVYPYKGEHLFMRTSARLFLWSCAGMRRLLLHHPVAAPIG